jgi:hypothetical protein
MLRKAYWPGSENAAFQVKTGGHSSTLIEVVFPHAMAKA